jgi:hypothetical protein
LRRRTQRQLAKWIAGCGCGGFAALALGGCCLGFVFFYVLPHRQRIKAFEPHLASYKAAGQGTAVGQNPYVRGKVVIVDVTGQEKIDDLYDNLPSNLQAAKPEEVATVVLLKRGERVTGKYTNGAIGYRYTCTVTVIDYVDKVVVAQIVIEGDNPPAFTRSRMSAHGSKPSKEIVDYITKLPTK